MSEPGCSLEQLLAGKHLSTWQEKKQFPDGIPIQTFVFDPTGALDDETVRARLQSSPRAMACCRTLEAGGFTPVILKERMPDGEIFYWVGAERPVKRGSLTIDPSVNRDWPHHVAALEALRPLIEKNLPFEVRFWSHCGDGMTTRSIAYDDFWIEIKGPDIKKESHFVANQLQVSIMDPAPLIEKVCDYLGLRDALKP